MLVHEARVRGREVSCAPREVVQHGVNSDAIALDLDGEWSDLARVTLVMSKGGTSTALAWSGEPVPVPYELMEEPGPLRLTVVGRSGSDVRVVTERMAMPLEVVPSGDLDGTYEPGDPALDEVQQAIEDAREAAEAANAAAALIPDDGEPGQVLTRTEGGSEWADPGGGGPGYAVGHGLKVVDGALIVDTAEAVEADNTLPITSAAVHVEVGNIEALLRTV